MRPHASAWPWADGLLYMTQLETDTHIKHIELPICAVMKINFYGVWRPRTSHQ